MTLRIARSERKRAEQSSTDRARRCLDERANSKPPADASFAPLLPASERGRQRLPTRDPRGASESERKRAKQSDSASGVDA